MAVQSQMRVTGWNTYFLDSNRGQPFAGLFNPLSTGTQDDALTFRDAFYEMRLCFDFPSLSNLEVRGPASHLPMLASLTTTRTRTWTGTEIQSGIRLILTFPLLSPTKISTSHYQGHLQAIQQIHLKSGPSYASSSSCMSLAPSLPPSHYHPISRLAVRNAY